MTAIYTDATPNGLKVSIGLEELGLKHGPSSFPGGEQMTPEFTTLNPNNKIPVLVDDDVVVSESGAILIYLAEKTGRLLPKEPRARIKTIEMVINQMSVARADVGAASGVPRILAKGRPYFAGDEYASADIAFLPWIRLLISLRCGMKFVRTRCSGGTQSAKRLLAQGRRGRLRRAPSSPGGCTLG